MQRPIADLLDEGHPTFSFEFFPPKTDEGEERLWQTIRDLEPLRPAFVDVTYGAGGSSRDRTIRIVRRIAEETSLTVTAHLTAVGHTRDELKRIVAEMTRAGVRNILALRGDPPDGPQAPWVATDGGLTYATELIELIRAETDACVGVAAFPEGHPASTSWDQDLDVLEAKVAAGADFAVTQFFFDAGAYERLLADLSGRGCDLPVIAGVMPVTNVRQIERFAQLSGADMPGPLVERLHAVADDPDAVRAIGVEVGTALCREALAVGAPGIHFYTLNRSTATREIHANLVAEGLAGPAAAGESAAHRG